MLMTNLCRHEPGVKRFLLLVRLLPDIVAVDVVGLVSVLLSLVEVCDRKTTGREQAG